MKNSIFEVKEGLTIAIKAIISSKIRSVLTTLGIIIGIWAVAAMSMSIEGINQSFQQGVSSLGSDNIYVDKWAWFDNDIPWWELRNRKDLTMDDYREYASLAQLPLAIAPTSSTNQTVKQEEYSVEYINITGTTHDYIRTTNLSFDQGRFFTALESKGGRQVAVLGSEINKKLFPLGNGLGSNIKIKGRKFKVVGILEEQGSWVMGGWNPDNQVYIPIDNIFKYYQSRHHNSITINVRAASSLDVDNVTEEAIGIMRRVRGLKYDERNDFSVNKQEGLLSEIDKTVGVIQIAGLVITGLALFVGAIGIMNIMFVSVKERTKEIGIRKAIGAKNRTILGQFISESAILCLIGGLFGLFAALITHMILQQIPFPSKITPDSIILAIMVSLIVGVLSGFAPAYTASKMDPVDSLRYE